MVIKDLWAINGTLGVSDVVVKFSQTYGKSTKVWLCFDTFADFILGTTNAMESEML